MQMNICHPAGFFLEDETLGETVQSRRRQERRCDRDEKQVQRDPMPFRGDGEPDEYGPRPPLAWVLMWGETYSNLYGYYVPDNIRRWGCVMWDAARRIICCSNGAKLLPVFRTPTSMVSPKKGDEDSKAQ
jgi:hypothetical protein